MRVNERFKKFQKHDWVFLCKPFSCLEYPHTLEHKKLLRLILITSYAAYQSVFALLTSSSSRLLLAKLSIICITWLILFVWWPETFTLGWKTLTDKEKVSYQKKSLKQKEKSCPGRKSLTGKEKGLRWKKKTFRERKSLVLLREILRGKKVSHNKTRKKVKVIVINKTILYNSSFMRIVLHYSYKLF